MLEIENSIPTVMHEDCRNIGVIVLMPSENEKILSAEIGNKINRKSI